MHVTKHTRKLLRPFAKGSHGALFGVSHLGLDAKAKYALEDEQDKEQHRARERKGTEEIHARRLAHPPTLWVFECNALTLSVVL